MKREIKKTKKKSFYFLKLNISLLEMILEIAEKHEICTENFVQDGGYEYDYEGWKAEKLRLSGKVKVLKWIIRDADDGVMQVTYNSGELILQYDPFNQKCSSAFREIDDVLSKEEKFTNRRLLVSWLLSLFSGLLVIYDTTVGFLWCGAFIVLFTFTTFYSFFSRIEFIEVDRQSFIQRNIDSIAVQLAVGLVLLMLTLIVTKLLLS